MLELPGHEPLARMDGVGQVQDDDQHAGKQDDVGRQVAIVGEARPDANEGQQSEGGDVHQTALPRWQGFLRPLAADLGHNAVCRR